MKSTSLLVAAGLSLAAAGMAQAQQVVTTTTPTAMAANDVGVLGKSYSELRFGYHDFRHSDGDAYNAGISGNAPVTRNLDVGFGYDYYWQNNQPGPIAGTHYDAHYHQLAANGTYYVPMNGVKPFLSGGIGYQWAHADFSSPFTSSRPVQFSEDEWVWGGAVGVEVPMGAWALTPRISYSDTMTSNSYGSWHYGAEAHHWFTPKVGGFVDATFHDPQHNYGPESWSYTVGVRMRF